MTERLQMILLSSHFVKQQLKSYGESRSGMEIIHDAQDNVDNYSYSGECADTDKSVIIREYACFSSGRWQDSVLEATSVVAMLYDKETYGYQDSIMDQGVICYDENIYNVAMNNADVACSGNDGTASGNLQDVPKAPLDLSMSSVNNGSLLSIPRCLQKETYSSLNQCSYSVNQSPIISPDVTSSSSSPASAAAAAAVVDLSVPCRRNSSLLSLPTADILQGDMYSGINRCSQSAYQSTIVSPDPASSLSLSSSAAVAVTETAAMAAMDLSVSIAHCRSLSTTPRCLQKETYSGLFQCPHSADKLRVAPSDTVSTLPLPVTAAAGMAAEDLSLSRMRNRSLSSIPKCLQKDSYRDFTQYPQNANQSLIASTDQTSLSPSSLSTTATATTTVELAMSITCNSSLSSMPRCLQKESRCDPNHCRESINQSPIALRNSTAAALDLSLSSLSSLSTPIRRQKETQDSSNPCPQSKHQSHTGPPNPVPPAVEIFQCCNELFLSDNSEKHICSNISAFSSSPFVYTKPIYGNSPSPQSDYDSFGSRARKRQASPDSDKYVYDRVMSRPAVRQCTSSLFIEMSSIENLTLPASSIASSIPPLADMSVLDTNIKPTLPNKQSSLYNPTKKRAISNEKNEQFIRQCIEDCSKTDLALLNKCNNSPNIIASIKTPPQEGIEAVKGVKEIQTSFPVRKRSKTHRRLLNIDTTSPVSGTIIKQAADFHLEEEEGILVCDDIEPSYNIVEVTPEAKAELKKIQNIIGDYICQLCKAFHEDAFKLAQHRCSRIVHVEYRCAECEKVFSCPANLASHSRWHKPKGNGIKDTKGNGTQRNSPSTQRKSLKSETKSADINTENATGQLVSTTNSISSEFFLDASRISRNSNSEAKAYENVDFSTRERCVPKTYNYSGVIENTSSWQTDDLLDADKHIQAQHHPFEDLLENTHANSAKFISNSQSSQCLNSKRTITDSNIVQSSNGSYESRLTPEERSLVRDILISHSLRMQTPSLTSRNTAMSQSLTDCLNNTDDTVNTIISKSSNNSCYSRIDDCESGVACNNCSNICLGKDTSDSTVVFPFVPHPVDVTRCREGTPEVNGNRKPQNPTVLSERQGNQQNECPLCGKRFQRHSSLEKHIELRHRKQNNTCSIKNKISLDNNISCHPNEDASNRRNHYGSKAKSLFCSRCNQVFATKAAKLKHDACMHGITSFLSCSICGMTFTSKTAVDKHVRGAHMVDIFTCRHCTSRFHSSPSLTRHVNKCHPTENRQVILLQLTSVQTC